MRSGHPNGSGETRALDRPGRSAGPSSRPGASGNLRTARTTPGPSGCGAPGTARGDHPRSPAHPDERSPTFATSLTTLATVSSEELLRALADPERLAVAGALA